MLYKQICLVSLAVSGFLTTHTFGANYFVYADLGDNSCPDATSNDTCTFYCNLAYWKQQFDCGPAAECNIYCSKEKCFESSTLNANNVTNNLNVFASGEEKECYKLANFDLPNHGNATFSIIGTGNNPFKQITVNSGSNTDQIIIDCDGDDNKDECKQITVNAQNAQYLEINVGDATLNGDEKTNDMAIINCPQNSNYNGPNIAPCYINATKGALIDFISINTLYGIPKDIWIDGVNVTYHNVNITGLDIGCTDTITTSSVGFTSLSPCWNLPTTFSPTTPKPTTATPTTSTSSTPTPTTISPTTPTPTTATPTIPTTSSSPTTYRPITNTLSSESEIFESTLIQNVIISESDGLDVNIVVTVIVMVISFCFCVIGGILFVRFRKKHLNIFQSEMNHIKAVNHHDPPNRSDEVGGGHKLYPNYLSKAQKEYIHETAGGVDMERIKVPQLCMVRTESTDLEIVKNAGKQFYGEHLTETPIEIEIEGNEGNIHLNNSVDDIDDEMADEQIIDQINTIKITPMGPIDDAIDQQ